MNVRVKKTNTPFIFEGTAKEVVRRVSNLVGGHADGELEGLDVTEGVLDRSGELSREVDTTNRVRL